jgi:hypothetical protein
MAKYHVALPRGHMGPFVLWPTMHLLPIFNPSLSTIRIPLSNADSTFFNKIFKSLIIPPPLRNGMIHEERFLESLDSN